MREKGKVEREDYTSNSLGLQSVGSMLKGSFKSNHA
jgi:hypothetical protein